MKKGIIILFVFYMCFFALGFIVGTAFVDYDFTMTMDNNTRIAIQSLNGSIGAVPNIIIYTELLNCKDQLRNETIEKMEALSIIKQDSIKKGVHIR